MPGPPLVTAVFTKRNPTENKMLTIVCRYLWWPRNSTQSRPALNEMSCRGNRCRLLGPPKKKTVASVNAFVQYSQSAPTAVGLVGAEAAAIYAEAQQNGRPIMMREMGTGRSKCHTPSRGGGCRTMLGLLEDLFRAEALGQ